MTRTFAFASDTRVHGHRDVAERLVAHVERELFAHLCGKATSWKDARAPGNSLLASTRKLNPHRKVVLDHVGNFDSVDVIVAIVGAGKVRSVAGEEADSLIV